MRGRAALVAFGALAIFAVPAWAATAKTFRLEGLGLSITLPPGWLQQSADPGWRFKAAVPTTGTSLFLNSFPATETRGAFFADLAAFERKTALRQDRHATVTVRAARVAGVGATEITAVYDGLTIHLYGFTHGGTDYTLEWAAQTSKLTRAEPVFASSLATLRFLNA